MKKCVLALLASGFMVALAGAEIITLNSKDTGVDHYYRPTTDGVHDWNDGSGTFNMRVYTNAWGSSWGGITYSDVHDTTTSGYNNQYAVYGDGKDYSDTGVYAIGYVDTYNATTPTLSFAAPKRVNSLYVNNTTYAALAILNGEGPARAFTTNDWFKLTITGMDASSHLVGTQDFLLADYTGYSEGDNKEDYMVTDWTKVDLSGFGDQVSSLQFTLTSSDTGSYGMNTPAYFALDHVDVVPEPSAFVLMLAGGGFLFFIRRNFSA